MAHWTQQITEAYRMMLEAKEAPAHHKDPHYMAMVQHNAKMHELVGGGGKVTKEHIDAAKSIIGAAQEAGHTSFSHRGLDGEHAGKIGFNVMRERDHHAGNPDFGSEEPYPAFEPVTHRTHSSWFDKS